MRFPAARILLFAKAPEPGRVKTRLLPAIGAEAAARLYEQLLCTTVARLEAAQLAPIQLWCAPDTRHPVFAGLRRRHGLSLWQQQGEGLGARMEQAAGTALREADQVLLIGGDCPALEAVHLEQALGWLASGMDAVIGPAEDGGYVLLGLRRVDPGLFRGMPWGGDRVLSETRERLRRLQWSWQELPLLWDLDRPADLERYRSQSCSEAPEMPVEGIVAANERK